MFTGIIETLATVKDLRKEGTNVHFTLDCSIAPELKVDQSVAHNGVCLTVTKVTGQQYIVTAIDETLKRTNMSDLKIGDVVNIERCMAANGRFDGHIVQGHVDCTARCESLSDLNGSWEFVFAYEHSGDLITVEKGSICVNGVSLTVVKSEADRFSVHVIPYTFSNTNFRTIKEGSTVNLEFDVIGKYVARIMAARAK